MAQLSLDDVVWHPVTALTAALGTVSSVADVGVIDALWATIWSQTGMLFTTFSIAGWSLAPQVSFLPAGLLSQLAIVAGVLYLVKLADRFWDSFQSRL